MKAGHVSLLGGRKVEVRYGAHAVSSTRNRLEFPGRTSVYSRAECDALDVIRETNVESVEVSRACGQKQRRRGVVDEQKR